MKIFLQTLLCSALLILCSCAPTTGAFEGSTETFENTTEASVEVTSSTSPRSDSHSSASLQREMAIQFASQNYDKVRRDISRGYGEYVDSLGELLLEDSSKSAAFARLAQEHYLELYPSARLDRSGEHIVARLEELSHTL